MQILLDGGHGGSDPGAVNTKEKIAEKDITLDVILALGDILENDGHSVSYIRDTDIYISPSNRLSIINKTKPDCFISIHCNASTNFTAHGVETIYKNRKSKNLAQCIQESLINSTGLRDRGVKQDERGIAVLKNLEVPSVLVEIFFLSNKEDYEYYKSAKEIFSEEIAEGVKKWI